MFIFFFAQMHWHICIRDIDKAVVIASYKMIKIKFIQW